MTVVFFFFNDTATTEIYTLSLHDALPISTRIIFSAERVFATNRLLFLRQCRCRDSAGSIEYRRLGLPASIPERSRDRKSTRLNSSHANISYAVFCLKKKKNIHTNNSHLTL